MCGFCANGEHSSPDDPVQELAPRTTLASCSADLQTSGDYRLGEHLGPSSSAGYSGGARRLSLSAESDRVDLAGIFLDERRAVGEPVGGPNDDFAVLDRRCLDSIGSGPACKISRTS